MSTATACAVILCYQRRRAFEAAVALADSIFDEGRLPDAGERARIDLWLAESDDAGRLLGKAADKQ